VDEQLQHIIHECLKYHWCIGEAKGHDEELKVSPVCSESGLSNVVWMHTHLVVPAAQVDLGEEAGTLSSSRSSSTTRIKNLSLMVVLLRLQ
jgi:hypothetical protein